MSHQIRAVGYLYRLIALLMLGAMASTVCAQTRPLVLEEIAKISPPGPDDQLVIRAGLSGNDLLLATRRNFDTPQGFWSEQFAYLFRRASDGSWTHVRTLASTSAPHLTTPPMSVGMSATVAAVVIGSQLMIYERNSSGWQQTAALRISVGVHPIIDGEVILLAGPSCDWQAFRKRADGWGSAGFKSATSACFGVSTDFSGQTIAVGNRFFSVPSGEQWPDRVLIFQGLNSLEPTAVLTDPHDDGMGSDGQGGIRFGFPVAIDRGTVFAGRAGAAVAFERAADGVWRQRGTVEPPDAFAFDNATTLQAKDDFIVAGYATDSLRGNAAGSARVFHRETAGSYREAARLFASDAGPGGPGACCPFTGHFGTNVDVDGRLILVTSRTAAYIFRLPEDLAEPALFQDLFQDGNADGWTPSTDTWSVVNAAGSLVYRQRNLTAQHARSVRPGLLWRNQSVQADVRPRQFAGTGGWFGVITRYTNASNYYYLSVHDNNRVLLQRKRNDVFKTLDSATLPVTVNRPYRLRVEAIGTWIRGYVDGELLVEAVDRTMRDGRPALVTSGAQADFDNVVVTPSPLTPLFLETFDNQFLNPHWQVVSGLWKHVQPVDPETSQIHGYYEQTSAQLNGRVLAGADTHDQVVAAEAWSGALTPGASYGLMARYAGDGNFYYLRVGENNQLSLRKFVNGSSFELDRATLVVPPGTWHSLRLEVLRNALRGYVDGRLILEARDQSHPVGKYGLVTFRTAARFDNVEIVQP